MGISADRCWSPNR